MFMLSLVIVSGTEVQLYLVRDQNKLCATATTIYVKIVHLSFHLQHLTQIFYFDLFLRAHTPLSWSN